MMPNRRSVHPNVEVVIPPMQLQRVVRQGDVISPKLFTSLSFRVGARIASTSTTSRYIDHLRFAYNIIIIALSLEDLN